MYCKKRFDEESFCIFNVFINLKEKSYLKTLFLNETLKV